MAPPDVRAAHAGRLRQQARTTAALGSSLYAHLCDRLADDVAAGGPAWDVLAPFVAEPAATALHLRLLAAVHRLVLNGEESALAAHYPSAGGTAPPAQAWPAFRDVLARRRADLHRLLRRPCQTNEVGRTAALACGYLWLAHRHGLPLRCLEIGTSAGLNLRWDHFRYGTGDGAWGPADSPVRLDGHWTVPPPLTHVTVEVAERAGCDPHPVDPTTPDGRLTLTASLWADQPERIERLRGALAVAAHIPARVEQAGAGDWLPGELGRPAPGTTTVVAHSVVWRYLPAREQEAVERTIITAGSRATAAAPLAWLRLEPPDPTGPHTGDPYPVTVTTWPGGTAQVLATAQAHGQDVRWCGPPR